MFFRLLRAKLADAVRDAFRHSAAGNDYHLFARVLPLDTGRLVQLLLAALQGARLRGREPAVRLGHFDELVGCLYSMLFVALDAQLVREPQELDALFADPRVLAQLAGIVALSEEVPELRTACSKELELFRQLSQAGAGAGREVRHN